MASRKTKKSKKKADASWLTRWWEQIDWDQTHRAAVAAGWFAFVVVLALVWITAVPELRAYAATGDGVDQPVDVRFVDKPAWVRGDLETRLRFDALSRIGGDPFAREDLVEAREQLMNTGWFTQVTQVERARDDLVLVEGAFVTPFAVVADAAGQHLVGPTGRLLPMTMPLSATHDFVTIRHAKHGAPARPGLQWNGADVMAALRLLKIIDGQPWRGQVAGIDLGSYRTSGDLMIVSDRGCRIRWGSPPGEERGLEAFADLKLSYLNHHFREHRHIDAGHHGEIDLMSQKAVTLRPPGQ